MANALIAESHPVIRKEIRLHLASAGFDVVEWLEAVTRRSPKGPVRIDVERRQVTVRGQPVELTRQEFNVLHRLAMSRGIVFSRRALLSNVRRHGAGVTERTVDSVISRLRRKIEQNPRITPSSSSPTGESGTDSRTAAPVDNGLQRFHESNQRSFCAVQLRRCCVLRETRPLPVVGRVFIPGGRHDRAALFYRRVGVREMPPPSLPVRPRVHGIVIEMTDWAVQPGK